MASRYLVQQTLAKAPKLLVAEAVSQGLAPKPVDEGVADGILPRFGGQAGHGWGDGHETTVERGPLKLRVRREKTDLRIDVTVENRSLVFDLRDPARLSVTLGGVGDPDGEDGDCVLIKQTANRQMGLGPPAMPDDSPVKAEVMARLRRDAGGSKAGGAEDAAPGTLEVRKHRLGQLSAAIDAFRLLDDSDYLEELKEGASPEDARVIDARLAAIAAGR